MNRHTPLYTLTELTGRESAATRTVTFGPWDMSWRLMVISIGGLLTGLIPTAAACVVIGALGVLILPIWMGAVIVLFHFRTRRGLTVYNFERLMTRTRANLDVFMYGTEIVQVPHDKWTVVQTSTIDNPAKRVSPHALHLADKAPAGITDVFNPKD